MTPDLTSLIERVESGVGPDRELDIAVWRQFHDAPANRQPLPWLHCYTTSLDAVLALIEAKRAELPDMSAADCLAGAIEEMMVRGWRPDEPNVPQICRAALSAALRAIQESRNETR